MATLPSLPPSEPDQDAEPTTHDGEEADVVDPQDTTPASDPDPEPGAAATD